MFNKAFQQGRRERSGDAYASVRRFSECCENLAGRFFSILPDLLVVPVHVFVELSHGSR
jgi:hypothetical protein